MPIWRSGRSSCPPRFPPSPPERALLRVPPLPPGERTLLRVPPLSPTGGEGRVRGWIDDATHPLRREPPRLLRRHRGAARGLARGAGGGGGRPHRRQRRGEDDDAPRDLRDAARGG